MVKLGRKSGVLMPIFSLPSPFGIGTFGKEAYEFIDFLKEAGQSYWQILPLNPTSYGDSPYQSFSAFALNPLFIDFPDLCQKGLLTKYELRNSGLVNNPDKVDYGNLYESVFPLLRKAVARVDEKHSEFLEFLEDEKYWLDDYSLFMAIKGHNDMHPIWKWDDDVRLGKDETLNHLREVFASDIHFWSVVQFLLTDQWSRVKSYGEDKGISIIGDMPIYVSADSADFWAHEDLFLVDENRRIRQVAGCPPDDFCLQGQRWGNPLYRWQAHKKGGYKWWIQRFLSAQKNYHGVRFDHFRGLAGYYAIPADGDTGEDGIWEDGPGMDFIQTIQRELPTYLIIAENLGHLTKDVDRLLKESGLPGMKVLQFAFEPGKDSIYLPHKYEKNCVVYTGTHDNNTLKGWVMNASPDEMEMALKYSGATEKEQLPHKLIQLAMESNADLCIIPIQDWLGLGQEARINIPGSSQGNWVYRVRQEQLKAELAERIFKRSNNAGRV